jgi:pyruvate kinase
LRKAKILITLGPTSRQPEVVEKLILAGANGVRMNMSHGTHEEKAEDIARARAAAVKVGRPLAILVDLSGPKIRTRRLKDGQPVKLTPGSLFILTTEDIAGDEKRVATNYPELPRVVQPGTRLLLDDGALSVVVESTTDTEVICRVVDGGMLGERKGINLPGVALPIDSLTEKDVEDLKWAVGQNADYIALSFVRRASDCERAKQLIKEAGGHAPLIAKIEKAEAIDHLDEIIAAADGLMVARGDLGVETSVELVPVYQKRIIERAIQAGKMVITATQMLQSMVSSPRPTRAEASDVANAVWDGTDCVMLSNETATGAYPIPAVATMARIIESAETGKETRGDRLARSTGRQTVTAVFTDSGLMARRLSSLRHDQRIIALTRRPQVLCELSLIWAVEPLLIGEVQSTEEMLKVGEKALLDAGVVDRGETIVVMAGRLSGLGLSSSVSISTVGGSLGPQRR